ncbi:NepR family anti-sigma factor [Methylobacterium sp. JK268]
MKVIPSNHAANFGQTHATASSLADALLLAKLGHDLRALYTDVVDQPVPDALNRLIARLDSLDEDGRQDG